MSAVLVEPFGPEHVERFARLFEEASSSCFCRYWHFGGVKNDWLDRCANRPEENLAEQNEAVARGDLSARGLVAVDPDRENMVVGWMKIAPRETLPKLTGLPVYKSLTAEPGTWTIGCFLVAPAERHRGVARALIAAAEPQVRAWGGKFIEAHPRRSSTPIHDEQAWQGPEALFVELGYAPIHDTAPYPVYRKVIGSA